MTNKVIRDYFGRVAKPGDIIMCPGRSHGRSHPWQGPHIVLAVLPQTVRTDIGVRSTFLIINDLGNLPGLVPLVEELRYEKSHLIEHSLCESED